MLKVISLKKTNQQQQTPPPNIYSCVAPSYKTTPSTMKRRLLGSTGVHLCSSLIMGMAFGERGLINRGTQLS